MDEALFTDRHTVNFGRSTDLSPNRRRIRLQSESFEEEYVKINSYFELRPSLQ